MRGFHLALAVGLRASKRPSFFDLQPCGAEKIHYFWTCNPAAQKKSIFFGRATLRRRKNPFFLDVQPCAAEKIRCFLTNDPQAQKKPSLCLQERPNQ